MQGYSLSPYTSVRANQSGIPHEIIEAKLSAAIAGYSDTSGSTIIAFTRLRRAQLSRRRFLEKYGETIVETPSTLLKQKLRARGVCHHKPWQPHTRWGTVDDQLFSLQEGRCYICSEEFTEADWATRDHVFPRSMGGEDASNILLAHRICNQVKADRLPTAEQLAYLARINSALAEPIP